MVYLQAYDVLTDGFMPERKAYNVNQKFTSTA